MIHRRRTGKIEAIRLIPRDLLYRVAHLLANLDFDVGCSIVLPMCPAISAKFSTEPGREWNYQNQSQPNPGSQRVLPPCVVFVLNRLQGHAGTLHILRSLHEEEPNCTSWNR